MECPLLIEIKITIAGNSQFWFLHTEKISNDHHKVNKEFKSGMKGREAIQKTWKNDSYVIIILTPTSNVSKTSPEDLSKEILAKLDRMQENNPRAKIAYAAASSRKAMETRVRLKEIATRIPEWWSSYAKQKNRVTELVRNLSRISIRKESKKVKGITESCGKLQSNLLWRPLFHPRPSVR